LKALEVMMASADFWKDAGRAKRVSKHAADVRQELETWKKELDELQELKELAELGDESMGDEIRARLQEARARFAKMEFTTLFSGAHDESNAIVSIHAGAGGTEAQDWTAMLARMFCRFVEHKGWNVQVLWESRGEEAGIKSLTFRVSGRHAFGYLRSEAGVHRLVRISPFDAEKMRHTSFALVEVIPELEDIEEIEINPKDLRIDTFMSGGKGGQSVNTTYSAVRIVHVPTNISVQCQNERSQQQNKETALKILTSKLHQLEEERLREEKQKLRGEYKSAEWGNQIRSYVLQPYQLVKDHRSDHETSDTQGVLDGDLEPFMEAYLRKELADSDRFAKANKE
jgi:peptide chain release factor 2